MIEAAVPATDAAVRTPFVEEFNTCVYAQYTIQVADREAVVSSMNDQGVPTAIHYPIPLHYQPVFGYLNQGEGSFPVAEAAASRVMSLPRHPYLTAGQQESVAEALGKAVAG